MATKRPTEALHDLPGYSIRRLQQIAVGIFLDETAEHGVTPVQFALLLTAHREAGLDQRTCAVRIGLDTSTTGTVVDRLESRGLIERRVSPDDKRVRLLAVTPAGAKLLDQLMPAMQRAQDRMLAPLTKAERSTFMAMLARLIDANQEWSRGAKDSA